MLVVTIAGAPQPPRRRLRKARPKDADPDERATVPLTTLTAIRPEPLGEEEQARAWLAALRDDEDGLGDYAREAAVFVNRAIHAHRTAALDPDVRDISLPGSLAVRIGYGDGEALADGRWDEAAELPGDARKGRYETLAPQERVAAIIGHHEPVDAATGALLRARSDVEAERLRDAALQLRVGLEAMLADTEAFGASGQAGRPRGARRAPPGHRRSGERRASWRARRRAGRRDARDAGDLRASPPPPQGLRLARGRSPPSWRLCVLCTHLRHLGESAATTGRLRLALGGSMGWSRMGS